MTTHETAQPSEPPSFAELFTSPWEELMECLVKGDLVPLLNGRGIAVESTHQRHRECETASTSSSTSWP
ncbi:MAG: hypothetical protein OXF79_01920 [Chloroflexi bacterium]|nr:hypothetical protein [Chloroflexota bacterium]